MLTVELLKVKRTLALALVVIAPLSVVLLTLFMASQAPFSTLHRSAAAGPWVALARVNLQFWGLLMLPMYIALQTALLAGVDHSGNQWKALYARPVPRWEFYAAKLILAAAMVAASAAILIAGIWAEGSFLNLLHPDIGLRTAPLALIARRAAAMTGLAFFYLAIQYWVSMRWRSFSVAIGFGIVMLVTNFAMLLSGGPANAWPRYFPWSLPLLAIASPPVHLAPDLWVSAVLGVLAALAGGWNVSRQEIA